jgi:hypothetical protein
MMTTKQIIFECRNMLKIYDQQGLLDEISMKNWLRECLKEFGGNLMEEHQTVLRISKGRVKLPENFWALKAAVKCEQEGYAEAKTEKHIQNRTAYLEWTEISDYYNYIEGKPCLEDGDSKYITETLYFEVPKKSYTFYYNQPKLLNLKNHIYKTRCTSDCMNLQNNSDYNISIDENHNYMTTNFNDGFVWLWYRGLPSDENGDLIVPTTSKDKLKNYIVYFIIVKTLQQLMLSEDDVNIFNKLQVFQQLADQYYYDAKSESVNKGLSGWRTRLLNNSRRNTLKYERMFGNL